MRILLIEDDKRMSEIISRGLKESGFAVDIAGDGEEGFYLAKSETYDFIVLDILLPKMDGFEILSRIRSLGIKTPVLALTAKDSVEDRVKGLDMGADDYLVKPFSLIELMARIRALLRRKTEVYLKELRVADLLLDPMSRTVFRNGKKIDLTAKEFSFLEYLMRNAGQVVTRTMISEAIWDYHFDSLSNVIDVYIRHLRQKIDAEFDKKLIHTVRGTGYVLEEKA
jgi:two-component system OmpR family response regulator